MKAKKVLKRIAKIEALISEVTERSSGSAPHIQELLREAKTAIERAKKAVSLQASSRTAKNPPTKHSKSTSRATPEPSRPKRKLSAAGRRAISEATKKRWAVKRAAAKAELAIANKATVKKAVPKKVAPVRAVPVSTAKPSAPKVTKKVKKSAPVKAAKAPTRKVATKATVTKAAVKAPAKKAAKAISAAPKKRRVAKKVPVKPGTAIAKTATAKVAPVNILDAHVKNVTQNATAKETTVLAPAKEVTEIDRDTNQPPEMESSAETPEQSVPEPSTGILRDPD